MPDALQLSFQLLSCRVLIEYEHAALEEKLAYLVLSARQELPVKKTLHYRVSGTGPYQVFEEGDFAEGASTPADVLHIEAV